MTVPRKNEKNVIFPKKRGIGALFYEAIPRNRFWRGTGRGDVRTVPRLKF